MQVIVYKNLNRGCWSVVEVKGKCTRGKLLYHCDEIALRNVKFCVSESGRQRVLQKKQRSVHAWAIGEIGEKIPSSSARVCVSYNPYRAPTFTIGWGQPIDHASCVEFARDGKAYLV